MHLNTNSLPKSRVMNIGLIHGWGMNAGAFTQLIEILHSALETYYEGKDANKRPHFKIYTITLPGHGEKYSELPEPYTLETIAASISPEIAENTLLIGWSLGGLVAQYLASKHHPNILALMTIASTPKFQLCDNWPGIKPEVLQMFSQQLSDDHHKTLSRFLAIQMMSVANAKTLIKDITRAIDVYPSPNIRALSAGLAILQNADIRALISDIRVPTLRTYGRLDSLVPHDVVHQIQALQPSSRHLIFKHASHAPFISDAQEFSKHIVDFVHELVATH